MGLDKLLKSKNRNLYIGLGLVILLLLGFMAWTYFGRKNEQHDLEEESELIRSTLDAAEAQKRQAQASQGSQAQPSQGSSGAKGTERFAPQPGKPSARPAIVLFHSSTCPHCKDVVPVWAQLRQQIGNEVDVMDFEAMKEQPILQQNGIEGVPEIRFYPKGFPSPDYVSYKDLPGSNRQLDSLIRFAMSHGQSA